MTENCLECHGTKDQPTLKTQAQVLANSDRILQAAVYTDTMPKSSNMDVAQRELLGEWLACGAP